MNYMLRPDVIAPATDLALTANAGDRHAVHPATAVPCGRSHLHALLEQYQERQLRFAHATWLRSRWR
jgi:hypothetical protein